MGDTGTALNGTIAATQGANVRYGTVGDPASNVRMFRMHIGPNADGVATIDNVEQPVGDAGLYWAMQPTASLLAYVDGGWAARNPVALIGLFVGDVTTDPNWLPFVRWVNSYYGTSNVTPNLPAIPRHRLEGWWDASVDTDFTYSFGSDPANPPNKYVSQWKDRSVKKNHGIGSANPGYHPHRDTTINGLKAVDFGVAGSYIGAGKGLGIPTWLGAASMPLTVSMVVRLPTPLIEDSWFFGCQSSQSVVLRKHANGSLSIFLSGIGGGGSTPAGTVVAGGTYLITCSWEQWGSWVIRINGVQVVTGSGGGTAISGADPMGLGAGADWGAQSSNSVLGEFLYYSRGLSAAEITQVETYLKTKWGTP